MKEILNGIEIAEDKKKAIIEFYEKAIIEEKKQATINANKILDNIATTFEENYKIKRLAEETQIVEYLKRATKEIGEKSKNEASRTIEEKENKIKELETKIKEGITDEKFKTEFETLKSKFGELNNILESKEKEIETIKTEKEKEVESFKINSLLNSQMPLFSKDVNLYELKYKKNEVLSKLKENFNLKLNGKNELIAENKQTFQTISPKSFLEKELKDYINTQNTGGGATPPPNHVTLTIPDNISRSEKALLIESHLLTKYKSKLDSGYAEEFIQLLNK